MSKFVFITGGVVSSRGKGLTSASIGMLFRSHGLNVEMLKMDPYLNVDPGLICPLQHGEVYLLEDGAETDLVLGHYERFVGKPMHQLNSVSSGKIYMDTLSRESQGDFDGGTVQVVPHITNAIKKRWLKLEKPGVDVIMVELGGTVGDMEGLPFLEAMRQFQLERPDGDVAFVHMTLIPYLPSSGEVKTKPTQHSVERLRGIGIQPDVLICRSTVEVDEENRRKIALFCNVRKENVIEERDVEYSIYQVPVMLMHEKTEEILAKRLGLQLGPIDLTEWNEMLERVRNPQGTVKIAVVGKYIELNDAYKSVYEALHHAGIANHLKVEVKKVSTDEIESNGVDAMLSDVQGILVPDGDGEAGTMGNMDAIRYAREKKIPFFGICQGMQCAVVEFARNVCGMDDATSQEWLEENGCEDLTNAVIIRKPKRLGSYACWLHEGTKARECYGEEMVRERHRCCFEVNPAVIETLKQNGMVVASNNPDTNLVEMVEISDHPWFVATQSQPQFGSRPVAAKPLFRGFVEAASKVTR